MLVRGCGTMRRVINRLMWEVVVVFVLMVVPIVLMLLCITMAISVELTPRDLISAMPVDPATVLVVLMVLIQFPALMRFSVRSTRPSFPGSGGGSGGGSGVGCSGWSRGG